MSIYIDVDGCCLNDSLPGGRLFLNEALPCLTEKTGGAGVLLAYDAKTGVFNVLDAAKAMDGQCADWTKHNGTGEGGIVRVDDMRHGDLFVDFGAAFGNGWRRSELYPRLKEAGVKIASYIHTLAPYSTPGAYESVVVVNFLYYLGALLQYADIVMVPANDILEEIDGLRRTLGLGLIQEYAAKPEGMAEVIAEAATCSPLARLANLFLNKRKGAYNSQLAPVNTDCMFPAYNLGSPIKLYLPCHDGISFELTDYVWTAGNTVNIRMKVRGSYRRGLCLRMDFSTFNGWQSATLYANNLPVGKIEASGRATRTIPIPASCIGIDRKLTIHMDLPNAAAPRDVDPASGDTRLLALRLFEMRVFDEDPYFACRSGEPLFFGGNDGAVAAQYCLEGVSSPEKNFTWTDGEIVTMRFCPFDFEGLPKSITLHYRTFLPEEHVRVLVNDSEIANYVARGEEVRTLSLPSNCLSADGFVMVSLRLPDAISPSQLNKGPDVRHLALQLFSVVLK